MSDLLLYAPSAVLFLDRSCVSQMSFVSIITTMIMIIIFRQESPSSTSCWFQGGGLSVYSFGTNNVGIPRDKRHATDPLATDNTCRGTVSCPDTICVRVSFSAVSVARPSRSWLSPCRRTQNLSLRKIKRRDVEGLCSRVLHWLPIAESIFFKLATLSFRCFDGTLPPYRSSHLSSYSNFLISLFFL